MRNVPAAATRIKQQLQRHMSRRAPILLSIIRRFRLRRVIPLDRHTPEVIEKWASNGKFEPTIELLQRLVTYMQPSVFVEVGSNSGHVLKQVLERSHWHGYVLAVEPVPHLARMVRSSLVERSNVHVIECALGAHTGSAKIFCDLGGNFGWNTLRSDMVEGRMSEIEIQVRTLDDVLKDRSINNVDLMKVDVEGFEAEVFQGARASFAHVDFRPVIVLEVGWAGQNDAWESQSEMLANFRKLGYSFFTDTGRAIDPFSIKGTFNCVLIPKGRAEVISCLKS